MAVAFLARCRWEAQIFRTLSAVAMLVVVLRVLLSLMFNSEVISLSPHEAILGLVVKVSCFKVSALTQRGRKPLQQLSSLEKAPLNLVVSLVQPISRRRNLTLKVTPRLISMGPYRPFPERAVCPVKVTILLVIPPTLTFRACSTLTATVEQLNVVRLHPTGIHLRFPVRLRWACNIPCWGSFVLRPLQGVTHVRQWLNIRYALKWMVRRVTRA